MDVPTRPIRLTKTLNNLSTKLLSSKIAWHGRRAGWVFTERDEEVVTLSGHRGIDVPITTISTYTQNILQPVDNPWDPRGMFLSRNVLKIKKLS